jgi:ribosomal protein L11 methyltransferase
MSTKASGEAARGTDLAVRVVVPSALAEVVGAVLMDRLGPYAEEPVVSATEVRPARTAGPVAFDTVALVFYPRQGDVPSDEELLELLPGEVGGAGKVSIERRAVARDWVDGWKDHFRPIVIGRVRVRPPWEPALVQARGLAGAPEDGTGQTKVADSSDSLVEVVINPGLAFGTGLHATTRGALTLLQQEESAGQAPVRAPAGSRGALVDVGAGSGILSIAAAKLGWGPIIAFDNDEEATVATQENIVVNGVAEVVQVHECGSTEAPLAWFTGATVLANMTLEPLLSLVRRLADARPLRLVVAGVLSGSQEEEFVREAQGCGFSVGRRLYESEWVSAELFPSGVAGGDAPAGEV